MPEITPKSWAQIAALGIVWGATFMVIELALEGISPVWLAAGRISFAAALMVAIWGARGFRLFAAPFERRLILPLLTIGAMSSALPFMLLSWGQQYVTSGFAGVSMAAVTLIILPMAHVLIPGERMTPRRLAGFLLGFMGVVWLIGFQALESSGAALETWGRLACLAAATCYAISSVQMRLLPEVDPIGLNAVILLIGAGIVLTAAISIDGAPQVADGKTLVYLAILGLIPTAGASLLRVLVVRSAGPVFMTLTNYQVPVWSVVFGALILGEPLPPQLFGALALILAGVAISQWGALKRLFTSRP